MAGCLFSGDTGSVKFRNRATLKAKLKRKRVGACYRRLKKKGSIEAFIPYRKASSFVLERRYGVSGKKNAPYGS